MREAGEKPTILVVDDERDNVALLGQILQDEYRVIFALSGQEAIRMAIAQQPDAILLDIVMPDLDGYAVCEQLKQLPETSNIPIIFVTGAQQIEAEERGFRLGGAEFITKPLRPTTVKVRLRNQLELRKHEELRDRQAMYDSLTGLPNRNLLQDRMKLLLHSADRDREKVAVLFIDLDGFKEVNDTLGHDAGDRVLVEAARRLEQAVRQGDTVARLGGDEFVIVLSGLREGELAAQAASKVCQALGRPIILPGKQILVTCSVGVAIYPDDAQLAPMLLRCADAAMYQAKHEGKNTYRFFVSTLNDLARRRLEIEQRLQGALQRGELHLAFQPMVHLGQGQAVQVEALLRWSSPELGEVPPGEFIDLAEQNGLMGELGRFILEEACMGFSRLRKTDPGLERVAVNLSAQQLRQEDFLGVCLEVLAAKGVHPSQLELEITEVALSSGLETVHQVLHSLRQAGVHLAMDDFGAGFSSLSCVRRTPFSTLKLDRTFVAGLPARKSERQLAKGLLAMAHALELRVVAEGVERPEQLQFLMEEGCDLAQGYLICPPLPEAELARWLQGEGRTPHLVW